MLASTSFDPELRPVVARMPVRGDVYTDVPATRASFRALVAGALRDPAPLAIRDLVLPCGVPVRIFEPPQPPQPPQPPEPGAAPRPLVVYVHGGGFVYGSAADGILAANRLVPELGATVVSVEYRLAPEHRFPAGLDDCYAALEWAAAHARQLGCDPARLAVMGPSAGGCLAAGVALRARDRGGPAIAFQCLQIAVLDDRRTSRSAREIVDARLVDGPGIARTWATYLAAPATAEAAPLRAASLANLPPAYIQTCELDPVRDDGLDYARRLLDAGVSVELYNVPGAFHAFELLAPDAALTRHVRDHWIRAMRRVLAPRD